MNNYQRAKVDIKLKAMLYTAAYIAGLILLGYLVSVFPWYAMAISACISICALVGFVYVIVLENLKGDR